MGVLLLRSGRREVSEIMGLGVKTRCPEAYFTSKEEAFDAKYSSHREFVVERKKTKQKFDEFKDGLETMLSNSKSSASRDHPAVVQVMNDETGDAVDSSHEHILPLLVYVAREKRPSHPHHFKAGALNVLVRWEGAGGIRGPIIAGCNFYMSREALYETDSIPKDVDINQLKKSFGSSNELIKLVDKNYKPVVPRDGKVPSALQKEIQLLASSSYDNETEWGEKVGFKYLAVVEDYFTGFLLHCKDWISLYMEPKRPCFLGACPMNLGDMLYQQTRWAVGLMQIGLSSKFCPLIYGPTRMPILESMMYAAIALDPLCIFPFYGLALIPQIRLVHAFLFILRSRIHFLSCFPSFSSHRNSNT